MNLKDEKQIGFTKNPNRQCRTCVHWLKLRQIPGAGACSSEEVCKRYRSQPIVVTDQYETCWCYEEDPHVKNQGQ